MSQFFGYSTWSAIVLIAFGLISGMFDNTFTTWFLFAFFCVVGLCGYAVESRKSP